MPVSQTYVHVLSAEKAALTAFIGDAESSFLELSLAPDVGRPTDLPLADAREWAQTQPAAASGKGWLPYLTTELVDAVGAEAPTTLHYAGITGMAVVGRVLRETTGAHPSVVLQSHTFAQAPREYTVYQYDVAAEEYTPIARGEYS
ncbi:hypothetical protein [Natronomonas sp.]|jgi:hypothetical protein|uniref:hypothetical protein n=1 Tax=Natronomonas sp. TaxID=2184060 RepID=UPI0039894B17